MSQPYHQPSNRSSNTKLILIITLSCILTLASLSAIIFEILSLRSDNDSSRSAMGTSGNNATRFVSYDGNTYYWQNTSSYYFDSTYTVPANSFSESDSNKATLYSVSNSGDTQPKALYSKHAYGILGIGAERVFYHDGSHVYSANLYDGSEEKDFGRGVIVAADDYHGYIYCASATRLYYIEMERGKVHSLWEGDEGSFGICAVIDEDLYFYGEDEKDENKVALYRCKTSGKKREVLCSLDNSTDSSSQDCSYSSLSVVDDVIYFCYGSYSSSGYSGNIYRLKNGDSPDDLASAEGPDAFVLDKNGSIDLYYCEEAGTYKCAHISDGSSEDADSIHMFGGRSFYADGVTVYSLSTHDGRAEKVLSPSDYNVHGLPYTYMMLGAQGEYFLDVVDVQTNGSCMYYTVNYAELDDSSDNMEHKISSSITYRQDLANGTVSQLFTN